MTRTSVFLVCLFLFFSGDAEDKSRHYRSPACEGISLAQACPLNYYPVCGSDGNTYPNECALCVHRLQINAEIWIMKDENC